MRIIEACRFIRVEARGGNLADKWYLVANFLSEMEANASASLWLEKPEIFMVRVVVEQNYGKEKRMKPEVGTKAAIKADYLAGLKAKYDWTRGPNGERGLELAVGAADGALAGRLKLRGEVWEAALHANGVSHRASLRILANLPSGEN